MTADVKKFIKPLDLTNSLSRVISCFTFPARCFPKSCFFDFSSSIRIYENQYKCVINENEFQFSLNPTLLSGSLNDVYYNFVTGSIFTPYITTVGLYNENNELLVVGKLSSATPIAQQTDTTIIVNFDT